MHHGMVNEAPKQNTTKLIITPPPPKKKTSTTPLHSPQTATVQSNALTHAHTPTKQTAATPPPSQRSRCAWL